MFLSLRLRKRVSFKRFPIYLLKCVLDEDETASDPIDSAVPTSSSQLVAQSIHFPPTQNNDLFLTPPPPVQLLASSALGPNQSISANSAVEEISSRYWSLEDQAKFDMGKVVLYESSHLNQRYC